MNPKGWSHVGLATRNMEATRAFYEGVLGFRAVRCDIARVKEGGEVHHVFFDTGRGQLLAFMEFRGVAGVRADLETNLNRQASFPSAFAAYHLAFEAGDEAELAALRSELVTKGLKVTPIVDHEWAKSIYFRDPNDFVVEFSFVTRAFTADDGKMQARFELSLSDPLPWADI